MRGCEGEWGGWLQVSEALQSLASCWTGVRLAASVLWAPECTEQRKPADGQTTAAYVRTRGVRGPGRSSDAQLQVQDVDS